MTEPHRLQLSPETALVWVLGLAGKLDAESVALSRRVLLIYRRQMAIESDIRRVQSQERPNLVAWKLAPNLEKAKRNLQALYRAAVADHSAHSPWRKIQGSDVQYGHHLISIFESEGVDEGISAQRVERELIWIIDLLSALRDRESLSLFIAGQTAGLKTPY
jgi:hypothetical protein